MLDSLYIKNLAIIDELKVSFTNGLNIITGETGAGKSLIIKAIQLLMGKRFSAEMLRTGAHTLVVEGVFIQQKSQIVIRRTYRDNGQSKSFINDEPVKQNDLRKMTRLLADLHGQHDHQNLLNPSTHLDYLDSFGLYQIKLKQLETLHYNVQECREMLEDIISNQLKYDEEKELHGFQLSELTLYPLSKEYEDEISKNHSLLSKASYIQETLAQVRNLIENGEPAIINLLGNLTSELDKISDYDDSILSIRNRAESNRIDLEDLILDIQAVQGKIVINSDELEKVNDIIAYIEMLKRKYGGSIESIVEYRDKLIDTKRQLGGCQEEINKLQVDLKTYSVELLECSEFVSRKRKETANALGKAIKRNLEHLNMPETQFKIRIESSPDNILKTGMDSCEFFISTNIGEELRPVEKIASGGEVSRIMLAVKMALQSKDIVNTLIFDEIDSGISGATADRVGSTIEKLSASHQILCITHLSQIAGKGNAHYRVSKKTKENRISVEIDKLSNLERIGEIATLISGSNVTPSSKKQAQELLQVNG